jgi:enamine deaminase RidA (YjgF/YER057c/UK114 family)
MSSPEERLRELGIELPAAPAPVGSYVPSVMTGNLLYLSGMLPLRRGKLTRTGRVGESLSLDEAQEEARQAIISALSVVKAQIYTLERVMRCVKLTGYVASAPDFTDQPKVLNTASDLLYEVFGERGRHTRSAVGVQVLPLNAPIEIELILEIADEGEPL